MGTGVLRAFVVLKALNQLSAGILLPVWLLLALARGLDTESLGLLVAVAALVTAALELPTGGLADVLGRRPVLVAGAGCTLLALLVLALAPTAGWLFFAAVLVAVSTALASGPLEAWFVDEVHACVPASEQTDAVTRGLALSGSATGLALAAGGLLGGGLAFAAGALGLPDTGPGLLAPSVPLLVAAAVVLMELGALFVLLPSASGTGSATLRSVLADVPGTVSSGVRLAAQDPVLRWFSLRWLLVPVGFLAFELLTPIRLRELLGDPTSATALLGPMAAGCFLGVGLTAALAPYLGSRFGVLRATALVTAGAGGCFAVAGLGGPAVLVFGVLAGFVVSGPVNALVAPVVHARVDAARRATLLSVRSLLANLAVALGAVGLSLLAAQAGTAVALAAAGGVTMLAVLPLLGVAAALRGGPGCPGTRPRADNR